MEGGRTSPLIFNHGTRRGWVVSGQLHALAVLPVVIVPRHGRGLSSVYIILLFIFLNLSLPNTRFMYTLSVFPLLYLGLMQQHLYLCGLHIGYSIFVFAHCLVLECSIFRSCLNCYGYL
jgi:hypothetical protein